MLFCIINTVLWKAVNGLQQTRYRHRQHSCLLTGVLRAISPYLTVAVLQVVSCSKTSLNACKFHLSLHMYSVIAFPFHWCCGNFFQNDKKWPISHIVRKALTTMYLCMLYSQQREREKGERIMDHYRLLKLWFCLGVKLERQFIALHCNSVITDRVIYTKSLSRSLSHT